MAERAKKVHVHMHLTQEATELLDEAAAAYGITRSSYIETWIRRVAMQDDVVRQHRQKNLRPRKP